MNKVFVWKSYGNIKVYATDTTQQLNQIIKTLVSSLRDWGIDDVLQEAEQVLESPLAEQSRANCINMIIKLVDEAGDDHESFEYCEFVKVIE
jgi:hypothetical protein